MKKNVFNLILGSILCLNVLSCTINDETLFEKDFVFVKGATIEGAIQAEGYPESYWFKAGAKHVIKDFYICNHEITQQEFAMYGMKNYDVRVELSGESIGPYYPAHQVNWFDVLMYCNRRSVAEGLTPCFQLVAKQILINGEGNPILKKTLVGMIGIMRNVILLQMAIDFQLLWNGNMPLVVEMDLQGISINMREVII